MAYFIEFAACPTNANAKILVRVDQLWGVVELRASHGDLQLTNDAKLKYGVNWHVVFKVYSDTDSERRVYYKYMGREAPHISAELETMVTKTLKEVLV